MEELLLLNVVWQQLHEWLTWGDASSKSWTCRDSADGLEAYLVWRVGAKIGRDEETGDVMERLYEMVIGEVEESTGLSGQQRAKDYLKDDGGRLGSGREQHD